MRDLQEESTKKAYRGAIKVASLTTSLIIWGIRKMMEREPTGELSINKLLKTNSMLKKVDLSRQDNLQEFTRFAKKYGIAFSAIQDEQGNYTIFFRAKNEAQMQSCLDDYAKQKLTQDKSHQREPFSVKVERAHQRSKVYEAERAAEQMMEKAERGMDKELAR